MEFILQEVEAKSPMENWLSGATRRGGEPSQRGFFAMMPENVSIYIHYKSELRDPNFEQRLKKMMKQLGYEARLSRYSFCSRATDLIFNKK